ncbi:hypothetical protein HaLaN_09954 [Haematococcus lacustris]|uniref:Uncharacterized protein n=1 Tax=Haematococcus lacustris TaxID=44745 RepID=A0A699YUZ1_HAELA|nr:hypothetical protein HaLaN_09954 [Haematococcus lacustris]
MEQQRAGCGLEWAWAGCGAATGRRTYLRNAYHRAKQNTYAPVFLARGTAYNNRCPIAPSIDAATALHQREEGIGLSEHWASSEESWPYVRRTFFRGSAKSGDNNA